jgi:putative FmdB family regulatory protein
MPIYTFECVVCDVVYELTLPITDNSRHECKECGEILRKVFSAPVITFKGEGWGKDA